MGWEEIEIPKELGSFLLDKAEETTLGQKMVQQSNIDMEIYTYENMKINF